jgi:hypothetical protein
MFVVFIFYFHPSLQLLFIGPLHLFIDGLDVDREVQFSVKHVVVLASVPERAEATCEVPARLLLLVFTALPVVGKLAGVAESAEPILKVPAQPPLLLRLGADARDRGGGRGSAGRRHIQPDGPGII